MTGNTELAKQIYNHDARWWDSGKRARKAGWRIVGHGGTRNAYLGPDGVVYKVGNERNNLLEAKASRQLRGNRKLLSMNIHVPPARTYRVGGGYNVIAMDYIKSVAQVACASYDDYEYRTELFPEQCNCGGRGGKHVCFGLVHKFCDEFGIADMFRGNIIYSTDNKFHIIDLGFQGDEGINYDSDPDY